MKPGAAPRGRCQMCGGPSTDDPGRRGICARCGHFIQIVERGLIKWKCPKCKMPNRAINATVSELAAVLKARPRFCPNCKRRVMIGDLGGSMN